MGLGVSPITVKIKYVDRCQTLQSVPGRYKYSDYSGIFMNVVTLSLTASFCRGNTLFHLYLKDPTDPPSLSLNITTSLKLVPVVLKASIVESEFIVVVQL